MEVWVDVNGYEGLYQVSNLGNVKSIKGKEGIVLKPSISNSGNGYYQLVLYKERRAKSVRIHQLVAVAFLNHVMTGSTSGNVIDHIDNNKLNNNLNNLQIVTQRYNTTKYMKGNTSKYVGVSKCSTWDGYRSYININNVRVHLKTSKCEHECGLMYQIALDNIDKYTDRKTFVAMVKEIYLNNYVR